MRRDDRREAGPLSCDAPDRGDEELPARQVEPGTGLVEREQLGVGHQRAGEHDARTLAL